MSDEFWHLTPLEFYELVDRWTQKQNRMAAPIAQLQACLINALSEKGAQPFDPAKLLPFPPKPRHLSIEESEAVLDRFFGGYIARQEVGKGN